MKLSKVSTLVLSLCFLFHAAAQAHDAWVAPNGDGYAVLYGHEKAGPYEPAKLKMLTAMDGKGRALRVIRHDTADEVRFNVLGKPALMLLKFDNGYWSQTTHGMKNIPKYEATGVTRSIHSVKYGKRIAQWKPGVYRPAGLPLEIVPMPGQEPRSGGKLLVQVLRDGKPAANLLIGKSEDEALKLGQRTDAQGKATVTLSRGEQHIWTGLREPLMGDRGADTLSLSSNLTFKVR